MSYPSVDKLQKMLAETVFGYAVDKKKASGRALGTLVEIVTFYTLCAWGLRDSVAIERSVPEFANGGITHNVEFSLHPIVGSRTVKVPASAMPLTAVKLFKAAGAPPASHVVRTQSLVSKDLIMRNAAIIADCGHAFVTANMTKRSTAECEVVLAELLNAPYAIFECKRVGVEEGMKKGPQSIEKAKQGAYVARSVSSLQKVRLNDGRVQGVLDLGNGTLRIDDYDTLLRDIIDNDDADALRGLILTVGVVSNHGNWFTAENHNKELRVLAQSYDWLLFLTDAGLCQFIEKMLVNPVKELEPARAAFLASYNGESKGNSFTKVRVGVEADAALKQYFTMHEAEVESWFNVIAPKNGTIGELREEITKLARKNWSAIRKP